MADGRIKEIPYRCGHHFSHLQFPVESITDIYDMLGVLGERGDSFIIRGEVLAGFRDRDEITRTLLTLPSKNQVAMLGPISEGTQWMVCDFDGIVLPAGMTASQGVEVLVNTLPDEFHTVSYAYQLSSSAGVAGTGVRMVRAKDANNEDISVEEEYKYAGWGKINAHVFFWMSKKHTDLAQWAKNLNARSGKRVIDPSFLETVQPNYCANPKFINMADPVPLGERIALVRKASDAVDLVWIDAPVRYVMVADTKHKVGASVVSAIDGKTYIATPSLEDRVALIGEHGEFREPLKGALGYYFWLKGNTANEDEIKRIIRAAPIQWGGRDYMGAHLDDLAGWYAPRNQHDPLETGGEEALKARLIELRQNAPRFADGQQDEYDDYAFELEDFGLQYHFVEGECGEGKTEWMLDMLATKPARYLVCLPRITMIREVYRRLTKKYPNFEAARNYHIETIYTDMANDIRDAEDNPDDQHSANGTSVTYQVSKFREKIGTQRAVILFITHAALLLSDWHLWQDFYLIVDEVPEPYQTHSRDFRKTADYMRKHIEAAESETNYHRLGLTTEGHKKVGVDGGFDDNEGVLKGLLEAIKRPNQNVYAYKESWDQMDTQRVLLMRLLQAGFIRHFRQVTIMGDEFTRSMLAMTFVNKYGVEWVKHPDWNPRWTRATPLKDRVRLFYFASKDEPRGSVTGYTERSLIPKIIKWFQDNNPGQTLITTNRRFEHLFEKPDDTHIDTAEREGIYRERNGKKIDLLWVPPKLAGTDIYKDMTNVAFFAALRPGGDEVAFVRKSLLITEADVIRWREYNTLFQFVMRICLRKFKSGEVANVYVYDEWQAEYLRERFGGCLEYRQIANVFPPVKISKGGGSKPKGANGEAKSALERKREQRQRGKEKAAAAAEQFDTAPVLARLRLKAPGD
jgi:hypothetical protein